ncbi:MAG: nitroreductase family protein [Victivallaceae bacterium]|nr:nitroreductase family protein [Victivallaceae bacterium]
MSEKGNLNGPLNFTVDRKKCTRCAACIRDCVASSLNLGEGGFPAVAVGGEERCIGCMHCMSICPTGAIRVFDRDPEQSAPVANFPNPTSLLSLIRSRRSYRRYLRENVAPETIQTLLDAMNYVPSGVNHHALHLSVIDDLDAMECFRNSAEEFLRKAFAAGEPKQAVLGFAPFRGALESGKDPIFRTAPHLIVATSPDNAPCPEADPFIALSYFELVAQDLGLGSCWCGLGWKLLVLFPELACLLRIPENHHHGYMMLFGNPAVEYVRNPQPAPLEVEHIRL